MLPNKYSGQELQHLIRRSMRQGDVHEVFLSLRKSTFPLAEKLSLRYKIECELLQHKITEPEVWGLEQIRSFKEILEWEEFQMNEETSSTELDKEQLLRLVNSFELEKALQVCESLGDNSILLQAQYKIFEKLFHEGEIELEIWELIRHSTQYQLWELANVRGSNSSLYLKVLRNIKGWFKGLFI